jgi:hypothetical protein
MTIKPIYVLALLVAAAAGTLTQLWQVRTLQRQLVAAQTLALETAADLRAAQLTADLALEAHRAAGIEAARLAGERDRAVTAYRGQTRALPAVPAVVPDTCRPWVARAGALEVALGKADAVIVADSAVIRQLERDTTALATGLREASGNLLGARTALDRLAKSIPTAVPRRSRVLEAAADLRVAVGGEAVGSLLAVSGPVYGGVEFTPRDGAVRQRWVVGVRKSLRIL